ncbi:ornithine carbamoyltransferase [Thermoplasmatales archaeon AK]|nr:ornithine carbamoyltransferase [Thermoplasmatales archaeon AK]
MKRDIISVLDMREDFTSIIDRSIKLKKSRYSGSENLKNRVLGMIFEKPSTRTRVSLETAMVQLGGHAIYLNPNDMQIGRGETIEDTAKVLSGFVDAISYRAFRHSDVVALARNATVPVINALDDLEHPVQMLADFMTIYEAFGKFGGLKVSYVGDGNNVANSLMLASALVGADFSIGCPRGYEPDKSLESEARKIAKNNGTEISVTNSPEEAVSGANVIYTDVWVSMGEEKEREQREKLFRPYQVNSSLADHADRNHIFLHCLPAHRGLEVTADVIDGVHSRVFQEAENRLHTAKGLLWTLLS